MNGRTPLNVQETKRQLILFVGLATETLTRARTLARRTEKHVRKLLRSDGPHFSESAVHRRD
jgi:hypothetical protein